MKIRGITKRWLIDSMGIVFLLLCVAEAIGILAIRDTYYTRVQQEMKVQMEALYNDFGAYLEREEEFSSATRRFMEDFSLRSSMELMVMDTGGEVVLSSTGFAVDPQQAMPDVALAKEDSEGAAHWRGKSEEGENIFAVCRILRTPDGEETIGVIRLVVSLSEVDRHILVGILILVGIGVLVIIASLYSGFYFINTIVTPVKEAGKMAKTIAQGNFKARLNVRYQDEIGDLCETINQMAEELGNADQTKNDFISSISHELRTPLTAIKGWADTLRSVDWEKDRATYEHGLQIIGEESGRLSAMVEELLDFSRIQSGRIHLMMDKMDLVAELSESVYFFQERATRSQIQLEYVEPEFPILVRGDRNRIRQMFLNILENAVKYSEPQTTIHVRIYLEEECGRVTIRDEGCGIPAKDLPHVKERFYRANTSRGGSGIGLAVVDEIIRLHGGRLIVESQENVGTLVNIELPLMEQQDSI